MIIETYNKGEIKNIIKKEVEKTNKDVYVQLNKLKSILIDIEQILRSLPTTSGTTKEQTIINEIDLINKKFDLLCIKTLGFILVEGD